MTLNPLYVLDFDGVICDSALETGMAGWKAALTIWSDMQADPAYPYREAFRHARPILETGYEAILIIRLLFLGISADAILADFPEHKPAIIDSSNLDISALKKRFSDIRDAWINDQPDEWAQLNPLFPGVAAKLAALSEQAEWLILTTKQERFVTQILKAHNVHLPDKQIYGLDRNLSKEEVLLNLVAESPNKTLIFVEDRLPALLTVQDNPKLANINLQLVDWGYNIPQDRVDAGHAGIAVINLAQFISL